MKIGYKEFQELDEEFSREDYAIRHALEAKKKYNHKGEKKDTYFPYVPYRGIRELYSALSRIHVCVETSTQHAKTGFIDVGAGTGRIVALAKACGISPIMGVEYGKQYIDVGRKAFGLSDEELVNMDAFDLTTQYIKNFGFIYTYMPIANGREMTRLHCHLVSISNYNTIFIEMLPNYYPMNMYRDDGGYVYKRLGGYGYEDM